MGGVSRFLSKRDKNREHKHHSLTSHLSGSQRDSSKNSSIVSIDNPPETLDKTSPADFFGLFTDTSKPPNKDEEAKLKIIKQKLLSTKGVLLKDGQILWALRSQVSRGETNATIDLLKAMSDASEGLLTPFNPDQKLKGAVNRQAVTCFLDSTLFSMFSRLDSFEAMLYNSFGDVPRERLAFLLRLWVNLLRSGQLITTDITKEIQASLAECGWDEAKELRQQDASEAFTFITERMNLPLLTLKMDIYHTGKQDNDDHKFINERLLEVAIPTLENGEHPKEIKFEDCLEEYFNNRIEVKRYLERRNTLQSTQSTDMKTKEGDSLHVETVELDPEVSTPLTPLSPMPNYMAERPPNRHRAASIIQPRYLPEQGEKIGPPMNDLKSPLGRLRTRSVKKEVLMPAWQFFSLIPWYTDNAPSNDAQVAAHFSSKRPVLGLCLKRYSYTNSGQAIRLQTYVDIPLEIGLPHFIQDDHMDDSGPLYGNFKLSLQSVVCHRGRSVDSGHYIALVRSTIPAKASDREEVSHWLRFDDLASQRVSLVDIHKALKDETPYLLFYQILPVEGDPGNLTSGEQPPLSPIAPRDGPRPDSPSTSDPLVAVSSIESTPASRRPSMDMTSSDDGRARTRNVMRRPSAISFTEYLHQPGRTSLDVKRDEMAAEHKKTGSFNESLSKTFSRLAIRGKKSSNEDVSVSSTPRASNAELRPEKHVDEVASAPAPEQADLQPVRSRSEPFLSASPAIASSGVGGVSRSRSKREKSRSRRLKTGKNKEDDDRECVVM